MEIKDAFDEENSDFSAMSMQSKGLYVSEVVHKAFVETSEEGTEAAASFRVDAEQASRIQPELIEFTIDHPFLFIILYKNQTLFMGNVNSL